jgi:hypothetical protein
MQFGTAGSDNIGRFEGAHWTSPEYVMSKEALVPQNILIRAEGANYSTSIEVLQRFEGTDTLIARPIGGAR